jgi:hypothetical protein
LWFEQGLNGEDGWFPSDVVVCHVQILGVDTIGQYVPPHV